MGCVNLTVSQKDKVSFKSVYQKEPIKMDARLICDSGYYLIVNPDKIIWAYPVSEQDITVKSNVAHWENY